MREFLGIDKVLQSIQGELISNTSKLKKMNECVEGDSKNIEEVEDDPTLTQEQRQLYRSRLEFSKTQ